MPCYCIAESKRAGRLTASEQLEAELDTKENSMQAKEQISKLEEELQAKQKEISFLTDQFEEEQRKVEMLESGKNGVVVLDCDDSTTDLYNYFLIP